MTTTAPACISFISSTAFQTDFALVHRQWRLGDNAADGLVFAQTMTELHGDFQYAAHGNDTDDVIPRPKHLQVANLPLDHLAQCVDDMAVLINRAKRRGHDRFHQGLLRIQFVVCNMFEHMSFGKNSHREIVADR